MVTFDGVPPDAAKAFLVTPRTFRVLQSIGPIVLQAVALVLYVLAWVFAKTGTLSHLSQIFVYSAAFVVTLASWHRRALPHLLAEVGCYRYSGVSASTTRLLPNTRQAWAAVMSVAALTVGVPLCMYLFTRFTATGTVYGFAVLGLSASRISPLIALCAGLAGCAAAMGLCLALVWLPLGERNRMYIAGAGDRVRAWIRLVSWLPVTLAMMLLFTMSRLLLCAGPVGRVTDTAAAATTCTGHRHLLADALGWLAMAVAYLCLDVGVGSLLLLSGSPVTFYALEPRLDGFFCEFLVWTLKSVAVHVTFAAPILANQIAGLMCFCLLFRCMLRPVSTVLALSELVKWSLFTIMLSCNASGILIVFRCPALVQALVLLLLWLACVAGGTAFYVRCFGWELFSSDRDVAADIVVL